MMTSGFNLDETAQFAGCIIRMNTLGLRVDDDDDALEDDDLGFQPRRNRAVRRLY